MCREGALRGARMVIVWLATAIAAALLLLAWWWYTYAETVKWQDLPGRVGGFSTYAAEGGRLSIKHVGSGRTIEFALSQDGDKPVRAVEFALPDMAWSADFFDDFVSAAESEGFACTVEFAPARDSAVRRFASVMCVGSQDDVVQQSAQLLATIAGFIGASPGDQARIRFRGAIRTSVIEEVGASR